MGTINSMQANYLKNLFIFPFRRFNFFQKTVLFFSLVTWFFLIWHEKHLPWLFILLLSSGALLSALILFFLLSLWIKATWHKFTFFQQITTLAAVFIVLYLTNFLSARGGWIFISFYLGIAAAFFGLGRKDYYYFAIVGLLVLTLSILTFSVLQYAEAYTSYRLSLARTGLQEETLENWIFDDKTRILQNQQLNLSVLLPEEMYHFNSSELSVKNKAGVGLLTLAISTSPTDPDRYPGIRLFYLPSSVQFDEAAMHREFTEYLSVQEKKNMLNELKELQPYTDNILKLQGNFWVFYDLLRPRYAKTGYYILPLENKGNLLIHITENLEKESYHEKVIEDIIESIKVSVKSGT